MERGWSGTLKVPYKGYRRVEFLEATDRLLIVRICDSGLVIEIWPDDVEWDG